MSRSNHPSQAPEEPQPPEKPLSVALWNFSSTFSLTPQGTAIISILLQHGYYQFNGLALLAKIVWIYAIVLLGVSLILYLLRVIVYPKHVRQQLRTNLVETSCLASFSIAFTSITQLAILQYGSRASIALYVLWWVGAGIAITACFGIPYVQLKLQSPGISKVSPATLLCFIAALTSAAMGGVLCNYGHIGPRLQVPVIIVAYFEIGAGLTLAVVFDALILLQHFDQTHLQQEKVWQEMILCGPFGQGSFGLQMLGEAVRQGSFAAYNRGSFLTASAATPIGYTSQFVGLLIWGYGLFWWCFAVLSICHTLVAQPGGWRKTRFNMSAWSLVFPWVGSSVATICESDTMNRAFLPMRRCSLRGSWIRRLSQWCPRRLC